MTLNKQVYKGRDQVANGKVGGTGIAPICPNFFYIGLCVGKGGGVVFPFNFHRLPSLIQLVAVEYKSRLTLNLSSKTAPPGND